MSWWQKTDLRKRSIKNNSVFAGWGSAHPSDRSSYVNYDLKTGKVINLNDILIGDWGTKLHSVAEKIYREKNEKEAQQSRNEDLMGIQMGQEKFELTLNFAITTRGLVFEFNEGEIAPYADGAIELLIPYSAIEHLIKRDGLLRR